MRAAICVLGAVFAVATARLGESRAQSGGDATDGYKLHMENGVKLAQDKNFEAAIVEFNAAYAIRKRPNPLLDVALCYKGLFNYPKAITTLEGALAKHADAMDPSDEKAARDAIAEMQKLLGFVALDLFPQQATVSVDGEALAPGTAAKPIPLGPGTHKIGARAEGYASAEQSITVVSTETVHASLHLSPDKGYVSVKGDDAAMAIAVDSKPMGTGAWAGLLAPGTHVVEMYEPGRAAYRVSVWVVAGRSQVIRRGSGGTAFTASQSPVAPVPPPPKSDAPPPPPPKHGPYAMFTGSLLAPASTPAIFPGGNLTSGATGGLRGGYRVNTAAAFELMVEYGNSRATRADDPDARASLSSTRFGLNLRLMTPGSRIRFVGALGGGVVNDSLVITSSQLLDARCGESGSGCDPTKLPHCEGKGCSGVDPYVLGELGLELDFSGVLLGAAFQSYFQSTKGIGSDPYGSAPLAVLGGGLRIGYALW